MLRNRYQVRNLRIINGTGWRRKKKRECDEKLSAFLRKLVDKCQKNAVYTENLNNMAFPKRNKSHYNDYHQCKQLSTSEETQYHDPNFLR